MLTKIRARAPLRLGFAGGGTDVSPYLDEYGGAVLNATINKYAYATIEKSYDFVKFKASDINAEWSGTPCHTLQSTPETLLHAGVYNSFTKKFLKSAPSVSVTTHSEAPPGSGLGSSSAMVVALIKAFSAYFNIPLGTYDIADLAYEIERIDLKLSGGSQDQYAATFGGFNFMEFSKNKVIVNPLRINRNFISELEASLVLFYTGVSRESASLIDIQKNNVEKQKKSTLDALHSVKNIALEMKEAILKEDLTKFANCLNSSWLSKKNVAQGISNSHLDQILLRALKAGATAGKVSGAGGGGFIMFLVDPTVRSQVINELNLMDGSVMSASFVKYGAEAWKC
ncbi:dehydrogenase [Comamonas aquatica]|uniref:GHMP family kinase ATP-binding protein n=1 Tax=Comamonas aquatica TaxID=225991 RepID=UPI00244CA8FD|nr:dehydrogenase [Comamonas aquatica]MDH0898971.1 dehydrogenase [Comamonas aquatica]